MMRLAILGSMMILAGAASAQEPATPTAVTDGPVRMTSAQISAYNANLGASDPHFIKCIRSEPPGSLVKRRVCRTNADWEQRADNATEDARNFVEGVQQRGFTSPQEPVGSIFPVPN